MPPKKKFKVRNPGKPIMISKAKAEPKKKVFKVRNPGKPILASKPKAPAFQPKYFNSLRTFLNDYRSVDGTGIKKVDEISKSSQEHRKLRDYTDKFDNLMLRKAQAKKERPFTEKQQKSIMDAISYIKDKFGVNIIKGKTGLMIR